MTLTVVGCRVDWREIFCGCHWLMQASCHSRAFKVLDPRVDDIDLERFCRPSHDDQDVSSSVDADGWHRAYYSR